jgi:hypothetical protein
MGVATGKLFKRIFTDTRVVDFDLSAWDRKLRLVVIAHDVLYKKGFTGKPFNVDFVDLIKFSWVK